MPRILVLICCLALAGIACSKSASDSSTDPGRARTSDLPIFFSCRDSSLYECHESFFDFEPASAPPCGIGISVRGVECDKTRGFLGACRSAVQGAAGFHVQSVIFYYAGSAAGSTRTQIEAQCKLANGEYLPD